MCSLRGWILRTADDSCLILRPNSRQKLQSPTEGDSYRRKVEVGKIVCL
jgi:hypothetical protein